MPVNLPDNLHERLRDGQSCGDGDLQKHRVVKAIGHVFQEIGLVSLYRSPLDVKLLIFQRFVRNFGYGISTLILVAYLSALHISDLRIGLFMTLTLIGDVFISFGLTLITDGIGRRRILTLGATLMALSGAIFAVSSNYWVLLAAAVLGVITPGGREVGPFRAIEESIIAHLTLPAVRADIFVWYSLFSPLGAACGTMVCGWIIYALKASRGWKTANAYRAIFVLYGFLGIIKLALILFLSSRCEANWSPSTRPPEPTESRPLLRQDDVDKIPVPERKSILPHISRESRDIGIALAVLQAVNSFASGVAPMSWIINYFGRKFNMEEGFLGSLFFTTFIITAISILASASLARRFGNIRTMVFTHIPAAIAHALLGFPSTVGPAIGLLIFRAMFNEMSAAPRITFISAILLPNERTAIVGAINVAKTAGQSLGPVFAGALIERGLFWVVFLLSGCLKATCDLSILAMFVKRQTREEVEARNDEEPPA